MKSKVSGTLLLFIVSILVILFLSIFLIMEKNPVTPSSMSYHTNIIKDTQDNENFRRVLFTGPGSQLVVMSIPPGGDVGEETHKYVEQTLFFLSGTGESILNGEHSPIIPGDVVVVPAGTRHNFINTGTGDLKIYTVYAPPNHIDGRVHRTKAEADADTADEAVGNVKPVCKRGIFEQLFGL